MFQSLSTYLPVTDPTWIFFIVLGIILFAPMLLERLRIPSIVGLIAAGVLIGPHCFHVLDRDSSFELFGKVGLYYIMFLASLEMNLQDVQKMRGQALTLGLLSFCIPMLLGFAANFWLLGFGAAAAVLMAAMYASHTLIAYPIVMRYGLARRSSVNIAVGGTIVADTLTLLVLAVVGGSFKAEASSMTWVWLLVKVVVLALVIVAVFPRLARWFFRRYDEGVVQYVFVLCLVFLGAGLMEFVGMEGILGAFLAGIVLNRTIPPSSPLMGHLEFVGNAIFIPYFLIGVGMLLDVQAFFSHVGVFVLAVVMIVVGLVSKWLAAAATQALYGMDRASRNLMFGLTSSRAAATLAVVLVGYGIVLPDGNHLLTSDVLNAAMMFILVTCIVSSFVTESVARSIAESGKPDAALPESRTDRILVALGNPQNVRPLTNLGLMLRTPTSSTPLTALNVVLEDKPAAREEGLKQLESASRIASASGVRLVARSRWSVNVVSGISHTMREFEASDLIIGLHQRTHLTDNYYGRLTQDLLLAVEKQVFIFRPVVPLSTVVHLHLIIPRKAEFEPGFPAWAKRIALLAAQLSCHIDAYSGRGTLAALRQTWEEQHFNVPSAYHVYNDWHDFISIAHTARQGHMIAFIMSRRGMLSYHNYMQNIPDQLQRYFSSHNTLLVFPAQNAAATDVAFRTGVPVNVKG